MSLLTELFGSDPVGSALSTGLQVANIDAIKDAGRDARNYLDSLGDQLADDTQFQGFGVRTGLGRSNVAPSGDVDVGVGIDPRFQQAALANLDSSGMMSGLAGTAANRAAMDPRVREQQVFDQLIALQQPEIARATAQNRAQEFATGRSGLMGTQFGGTAQDDALARAQTQARRQAAVDALGITREELANQAQIASQLGSLGVNQANIGSGLFGTAMDPTRLQLDALNIGSAVGGAPFQTGQLTGAGYRAQTGLAGAESQLQSERDALQAQINLINNALGNLGTATVSGGGQSGTLSGLTGLLGAIPQVRDSGFFDLLFGD